MQQHRLGQVAQTDRGSVTIWSLGLVIALLFVGGLGLDLWRGVSDRQRLASIADAAAAAGATAVDPASLRDGLDDAYLDEALATERAWESILSQGDVSGMEYADVGATTEQVEVAVHGSLNMTLMRVLYPADALAFTVTGSASPVVAAPGA